MSKEDKKNKSVPKRWVITPVVFLLIILILTGGLLTYQTIYAEKFYRGVKIGFLDVGGMTKAESLKQLQDLENNIQDKGITFYNQKVSVVVPSTQIAIDDPDLAKSILSFDWQKTIDDAFDIGRNGNWFQKSVDQVATAVAGESPTIHYNLEQSELSNILQNTFTKNQNPAKDAELTIEDGEIIISDEVTGIVYDYAGAIRQLQKQISNLDFSNIEVTQLTDKPLITKAEAEAIRDKVVAALELGDLTLVEQYEDEIGAKRILKSSDYIDWLEFQRLNGEVVVGLNKEKALAYLEPITENLNVSPLDAKFRLEGKRVIEFQASRDGKHLDVNSTYEFLNNRIILNSNEDIPLIVAVTPAKVATGDLNDLGIEELLGRGSSNFGGSPPNRRYNIGIGADSVDGLLIEPGEEFSLLEALGEIDGSTGYLQELVIKGDRTIPEYGGGLCQIGTTAFRSALNAGLPITARRNHSFRVRYYEPPVGMDATIYDPAPDFRFLNDTGNYLLYVTYIDGDEAVFELWGTKDGRKIEMTEPIVYNITSPGEPRYIYTDELPEGERRKVESAVPGADAEFTYTVTYPNGEVKEETFTSHYVPWKETWLVGGPNPADLENASSTEEGSEEIIETTIVE